MKNWKNILLPLECWHYSIDPKTILCKECRVPILLDLSCPHFEDKYMEFEIPIIGKIDE